MNFLSISAHQSCKHHVQEEEKAALKLLLTISLGLMAFSLPALCWPVEEDIMLESFTPPDSTMSKTEGKYQQENIAQGKDLFMC